MSAASSHEASWGRLRGDVDNTAGEAALTGASYVDDRHGGCMALAKGYYSVLYGWVCYSLGI